LQAHDQSESDALARGDDYRRVVGFGSHEPVGNRLEPRDVCPTRDRLGARILGGAAEAGGKDAPVARRIALRQAFVAIR
jgi:hypothetical protein